MVSEFNLYLLTRLDAIKAILILASVIAFVVNFIYVLWTALDSIEKEIKIVNAIKKKVVLTFLLIMILAIIINGLIPSTKEMLFIKAVPKIYNSNFVQEDILLNIKDYLKEISNNNKG